jgi:hypothetical protein
MLKVQREITDFLVNEQALEARSRDMPQKFKMILLN